MTVLSPTLMPVHVAPMTASPRPAAKPRPEVAAEALVDERLFGAAEAAVLRHEDQTALTTVSWILFSIVTAGCLLMLGSVAVVVF